MSKKFHISKSGDPKPCDAVYHCPLGSDDEHFSTRDEARTFYEKKMTDQLMPSGDPSSVGKRELNQLAKFTSDNDVIMRILEEGSDTALRGLAKNPNAGMHHLVRAYNKTNSEAAKAALALAERFPVDKMSPAEAAAAYKDKSTSYSRQQEIVRSNSITDAHLDALQGSNSLINYGVLSAAIENGKNKLSQERIVAEAERSSTMVQLAIESGRYPLDRIKDLPENKIPMNHISTTQDPAALAAYGEWTEKNAGIGWQASHAAGYIAANPNTPTATLDKLADNGLALTAVYSHPNASEATRQKAYAVSDEVKQVARLKELDAKVPGGVLNAIKVADHRNQPFRNRGIYDSSIQLNPEKVKELGLSNSDIYMLMDAKQYNGGVSYNPETGVFRGTVDSTD